ncbi:MAG: LPXTG cell wall anchor domain-containing protein [Marinilabiliaceae bacterium]
MPATGTNSTIWLLLSALLSMVLSKPVSVR